MQETRDGKLFCVHLFQAECCQPGQPIAPSSEGNNRFIFNPSGFSPLTAT